MVSKSLTSPESDGTASDVQLCSLYHYRDQCHRIENAPEIVNSILKDHVGCKARDFYRKIENTDFHPWHNDCHSGTTLIFKHRPPKILYSQNKLFSTLAGEAEHNQNDNIQEFCPVYSNNTCLSKDVLHVPSCGALSKYGYIGHNFSIGRDHSEHCGTIDTACEKKEQSFVKKGTQSVWCACSTSNKRKCGANTVKLKEVDLLKAKFKHNIRNYQRGKWILKEGTNGTPFSITVIWKKVCSMLRQGELSCCNAKFQRQRQEIWIYCDFVDSIKVRRTLQKNLEGLTTTQFHVHPHGMVMNISIHVGDYNHHE